MADGLQQFAGVVARLIRALDWVDRDSAPVLILAGLRLAFFAALWVADRREQREQREQRQRRRAN